MQEVDGCGGTDFLVDATIGGQEFKLIVDTGSSTVGVASDLCTTCSTTTNLYNLTTGTNQQSNVQATYGDGSGWSATVYSDTVAVAGTSTRLNLGAITTSSGFFRSETCSYNQPDALYDGILGLAYNTIALPNTNSYAEAVGLPFQLQMCDFIGELTFQQQSALFSPTVWLPVVVPAYYTVQLSSVTIGNNTIVPLPVAVVFDSGTTLTYLPQSQFDQIATALNNESDWVNVFGHDFLTGNECISPHMPINMSLSVSWNVVGADGCNYSLQVSPLRLFVYPVASLSNRIYMCPGIAVNDDVSIFGWTFLNQFTTVFDVGNRRIGLSAAKVVPCDQIIAPSNQGMTVSQPFFPNITKWGNNCTKSNAQYTSRSTSLVAIFLCTIFAFHQLVHSNSFSGEL
jgi:hypothetical protein